MGVARTLLSLEGKLKKSAPSPPHTAAPCRSTPLPMVADLQMELAGTIGVLVQQRNDHRSAISFQHRQCRDMLLEMESKVRREIEVAADNWIVDYASAMRAQLRNFMDRDASLREEVQDQHKQRLLLHQQLSNRSDELELKSAELYRVRREADAKDCEHHELIRALRNQQKIDRKHSARAHRIEMREAVHKVEDEHGKLLQVLQMQLEGLQAKHEASMVAGTSSTPARLALSTSDCGTQISPRAPEVVSSHSQTTSEIGRSAGDFPNLVDSYQRRLEAADRNTARQSAVSAEWKQRCHDQQLECDRLKVRLSLVEASVVDSTSMAKELGKLRAKMSLVEASAAKGGGAPPRATTNTSGYGGVGVSFLTSTSSTSQLSSAHTPHRNHPTRSALPTSVPPSPLAHRQSRESSFADTDTSAQHDVSRQ